MGTASAMCTSGYERVTIRRIAVAATGFQAPMGKGARNLIAGSAAFVLLLVAAQTATDAATVPTERALYTDAPNGMFLLDRDWTTRADPHDTGIRRGWWRRGAGAGFRPTSIPNAFNARSLSRRSFDGGVQWYRATFTAPQVDAVAGWRVRFESVNVDATVWLNGKRIGHHRGAYLPFELMAGRLL